MEVIPNNLSGPDLTGSNAFRAMLRLPWRRWHSIKEQQLQGVLSFSPPFFMTCPMNLDLPTKCHNHISQFPAINLPINISCWLCFSDWMMTSKKKVKFYKTSIFPKIIFRWNTILINFQLFLKSYLKNWSVKFYIPIKT